MAQLKCTECGQVFDGDMKEFRIVVALQVNAKP